MPDWDSLILSSVTLVAGLVLGAVGPWLQKMAKKMPPGDMALVLQLASLAVPLIERQFPALRGAQKLGKAVDVLNGWLRSRGIRITAQELEAAVEKAWAGFEASGEAASYKKKTA